MRNCSWLLAAVFVLCATLGCGSRGPDRFDVSGKVTFRGKPVPVGRILFVPIADKGTAVLAGAAAIKDGAYDTRNKGKGTSGGQYMAVISGFDGNAVKGDEVNSGKQIFPDYRVNVDLPREPATKDFDLPPAQ